MDKYLNYSSKIIIGIAVIVAILVFFGPCGNRKVSQQFKQLQAENKALQDKAARDSAARAQERIAEKGQLEQAREETAKAKADMKAADRQLSATQSEAVRLARTLLSYRNSKPDSSFTTYEDSCEDLARKVIEQDGQINAYKTEVDETIELMNYEIVLRDSVIEKEVSYIDSLRADFNRQGQLLKQALAVGKPRGKLLAGAGVIGNQTTFLSGAKIALAYQTKGGKQYQGGAILMGGTVYYEAVVLIQIYK